MTIRVSRERLDRINARAKAAGLTRSQYVMDRADPEGATERLTDPVNMVRPTTACVHPKAARQVLGWGTVCAVHLGGCGSRLG